MAFAGFFTDFAFCSHLLIYRYFSQAFRFETKIQLPVSYLGRWTVKSKVMEKVPRRCIQTTWPSDAAFSADRHRNRPFYWKSTFSVTLSVCWKVCFRADSSFSSFVCTVQRHDCKPAFLTISWHRLDFSRNLLCHLYAYYFFGYFPAVKLNKLRFD